MSKLKSYLVGNLPPPEGQTLITILTTSNKSFKEFATTVGRQDRSSIVFLIEAYIKREIRESVLLILYRMLQDIGIDGVVEMLREFDNGRDPDVMF